MAAPNNPDDNNFKVRVYKLANVLKARLGPDFKNQEQGFLAPEAIEEADKYIKTLCVDCPGTIEKHLGVLSALWAQMKDAPDTPERADMTCQIFTLAHEIKDVGSMCDYELISYFAESLRDYIEQTELNIQAQIVIIQAHLDAMQICHRQGFKKEAGPEAEELKKMVKKAIDKYK